MRARNAENNILSPAEHAKVKKNIRDFEERLKRDRDLAGIHFERRMSMDTHPIRIRKNKD